MTDLPKFNLEEAQIFKDIATSQHDHPVFMLTLNRYKDEADYPSGHIYKSYMLLVWVITLLFQKKRKTRQIRKHCF